MVRGSCLCGGIRFEAAKVPLIVLCHCSMCRKSNGAAFDCGAMVPAADFTMTQGADLVERYESSPGFHRTFCRVCGARAPGKAEGDLYFVPAGLLDDDPGVKPALHIFVGSKAPWWEIDDDLPQFDQWPPGYGPD